MTIVNMQAIAKRKAGGTGEGNASCYNALSPTAKGWDAVMLLQCFIACGERHYCLLPTAYYLILFAIPDLHYNFAGMEITLNNEPLTLDGESITVANLLDQKRYTFRMRTVKINGRLIDRDSYDREMIHDGDTVQVIYLMSGG